MCLLSYAQSGREGPHQATSNKEERPGGHSCGEATRDRGRQNSSLIQEEQQRQALRQEEKWCRQAMPSSEEPGWRISTTSLRGSRSEVTLILIDFAVPLVLKAWWMVVVWGAWGTLEEETVLWI